MRSVVQQVLVAAASLPLAAHAVAENSGPTQHFSDSPLAALTLASSPATLGFAWPARIGSIEVDKSNIAIALVVLGAILVSKKQHRALEQEQSAERARNAIPEFDQFIGELDAFNKLHLSIDGIVDTAVHRSGRAQSAPDISHDAAFTEAWRPFLHPHGFALFFESHPCGEAKTYRKFELRVRDPEKALPLLEAYGNLEGRRAILARRSLTVLSEASEQYLIFELSASSCGNWHQIFETNLQVLVDGFKAAHRPGAAERLEFYKTLCSCDKVTAQSYAHFRCALRPALTFGDAYYITPASLAQALAHLPLCVKPNSPYPALKVIGERALDEMDTAIEKLEELNFQARHAEQLSEVDGAESEGGVATAVAPNVIEPNPDEIHHPRDLLRAKKKVAALRQTLLATNNSVPTS
jgi:hypothetical protein